MVDIHDKPQNTMHFFMKAAIFEKPGLENLKVIDNAARPESSAHALRR